MGLSSGEPTYRVMTSDGERQLSAEGGHVLSHEHVVIDMRVYWEGPGSWDELDTAEQELGLSTQQEHRRRPQGTSRENLVLSDWYIAAKELREARDAGCQLVVDLTTSGLDPRPGLSVKACELAGIPVVLSVGRYLGHSLRDDETRSTSSDLTDQWLGQVQAGVDGFSVGMIGEIGTSAQISPVERNSLEAAARVQRVTGLPVNVHVDPFGRQGHNVLDILETNGADLSKVALSHCDGDIDLEWLASLASRGAYVEFDLFGTNPDWKIMGRGFNSDTDRIEAIEALIDLGHVERILLSHDICMKNSLKRFGGWGYGHLGKNILPLLDARVGTDLRKLISAVNPLRHLSLP